MLEIGIDEVKAKLEAGDAVHLLDVREPDEVSLCGLPGAENIPMLDLFTGARKPSAPPEAEIVVFCHHGPRSFEAARFLQMQGYGAARSMAGGIDAWAATYDSAMRRY